MNEINPLTSAPVVNAVPETRGLAPWSLILAFLLSLGLVLLVLYGGWSLGFFLAVLLAEAVIQAWRFLPSAGTALPPAGPQISRPVQIVLTLAILDLGLCACLYDDIAIKVLNVLTLMALLPLQHLLLSGVFLQGWDRPGFWLEACVAFIVRPFSGLAGFGRSVARLFQRHPSVVGQPAPAGSGRLIAGKIILGLLMAIPVLLISGSLLTSADAVFANALSSIWSRLSIQDAISQLVIALILLPFIFSFLYSGKTRQRLIDNDGRILNGDRPANKGFRIDKTILITFLTCINLLYLAFAIVQLTYLTGAFSAVLPADMTYAEYARSGFFELAGVTFINLILVLLAVKGADRRGAAGVALRVESLLLVTGSLIQWASAMFRMKMYIDTFGLSLLRFWVTAFMLLQLVVFLLLLVKEFAAGFPLFKSCAAAVLAALLILNHIDSDAWIANNNVDRYLATGQIDTDFFSELSSSAVPAMLRLADAGEPEVSAAIAGQLLERNENLNDRLADRWQNYNAGQVRAVSLIGERLEDLRKLSQR